MSALCATVVAPSFERPNGNGIEGKSNNGTVPMLAKWSARSSIILTSGGMRIYVYNTADKIRVE